MNGAVAIIPTAQISGSAVTDLNRNFCDKKLPKPTPRIPAKQVINPNVKETLFKTTVTSFKRGEYDEKQTDLVCPKLESL